MANEDEMERISNELQLQQARGDAIRQQMQAMQNAILEVGSAIEAIEGLKKAKGDTLVPIGAGVFMSCPKPDPENVVLSIGAGMLVRKKAEEALKLLNDRQKRMSDALGASQQNLEDVVKNIERLSAQAGAIGAAEEKRNVRASEKQAD